MAAGLRVYTQKIRSAQTTKKITKAMELIAASRINKAMARVRASTPYARAITHAVSAVATYSNVNHPLTTEPEVVRKAAVVVFTSDRGLAGAFNSQILREASELSELLKTQGKEVSYYAIGRKASAYYNFRKIEVTEQWHGISENPEFEDAQAISNTLLETFLDESGVDEIHIVYNRFVSMMTQTPEVVRLLPLEVVESVEEPDDSELIPLYEFEPDAETVLDTLLPEYIQSRIFNALLQSAAAKHAATQKAMKSASDNADKLITTYTRLRNNARQAEITQQISEIVGGADALVDDDN